MTELTDERLAAIRERVMNRADWPAQAAIQDRALLLAEVDRLRKTLHDVKAFHVGAISSAKTFRDERDEARGWAVWLWDNGREGEVRLHIERYRKELANG